MKFRVAHKQERGDFWFWKLILGKLGAMKKGTQTSDNISFTINKDLGLLKKVQKQESA